MDVIQFSQKTKQEAKNLLRQGNVLEVLSQHGEVVLSGAYKYDLMWGPDIDVVVICDNPEEASQHALQDFIKQRNFQKYQLGDFAAFPLTNRPQSMIVVLIHEFAGRRWEIEIWFQKSLPESTLRFDKLLSNISQEQRKTILELKHHRELVGTSKLSLSSTAIYEGVLIENKSEIGDFSAKIDE